MSAYENPSTPIASARRSRVTPKSKSKVSSSPYIPSSPLHVPHTVEEGIEYSRRVALCDKDTTSSEYRRSVLSPALYFHMEEEEEDQDHGVIRRYRRTKKEEEEEDEEGCELGDSWDTVQSDDTSPFFDLDQEDPNEVGEDAMYSLGEIGVDEHDQLTVTPERKKFVRAASSTSTTSTSSSSSPHSDEDSNHHSEYRAMHGTHESLSSTEEDEEYDLYMPEEDDEEDEEDTASNGYLEEEFNPYLFIKQLPPYHSVTDPSKVCLPPKCPTLTTKKTLVLDLDETLVHCSIDRVPNPDHVFPVQYNGVEYQVHVKKRPFLDYFLQTVSREFEVIVFTASQAVYANTLLDYIDPSGTYIHHRLFRDACLEVGGNFLKDLSVLGRQLDHSVLVDNSPHAYSYHVDNGIPIESWFDDPSDTELLKLVPFLRKLHRVKDVRPLVRKQFKTHLLVKKA
jgi:CTD small phosphatase-like protein 2